jgi:hypothetical protein
MQFFFFSPHSAIWRRKVLPSHVGKLPNFGSALPQADTLIALSLLISPLLDYSTMFVVSI